MGGILNIEYDNLIREYLVLVFDLLFDSVKEVYRSKIMLEFLRVLFVFNMCFILFFVNNNKIVRCVV